MGSTVCMLRSMKARIWCMWFRVETGEEDCRVSMQRGRKKVAYELTVDVLEHDALHSHGSGAREKGRNGGDERRHKEAVTVTVSLASKQADVTAYLTPKTVRSMTEMRT